jgi:hypothetical protein
LPVGVAAALILLAATSYGVLALWNIRALEDQHLRASRLLEIQERQGGALYHLSQGNEGGFRAEVDEQVARYRAERQAFAELQRARGRPSPAWDEDAYRREQEARARQTHARRSPAATQRK